MADEEKETRVDIGYLEKCESWKLESRFFRSKVGGKPSWLDLKNVPTQIKCDICLRPCVFLCQVYAPIEDDPKCFHRTIFVFICRNARCCNKNNNSNFKVLRCQLPRNNAFYSPEPPFEHENWQPDVTVTTYIKTCNLCGCHASKFCSKCETTFYCSKNHQVVDWKNHKETCGTAIGNVTTSNSLFGEFEIVTEPELVKEEEIETEESDAKKLEQFETMIAAGEGGTLQNVDYAVLEEHGDNTEIDDKYFHQFKKKISHCPDQVIRYDRGGVPLWISEYQPSASDIPKCEQCNGDRQFEFQILSTLLNYFDVDRVGESIDWGNLLVYTCKQNCDEGSAYKSEFLWKQDISE